MTFVDVLLNIIIPIITGVVTAIPLIIKLVQTIKEAAKSKNWTILMQLVNKLVKEAEILYTNGADRKTWVIQSIKAMEKSLNFDVDEELIGEMIDSIVDVSKNVNVNK